MSRKIERPMVQSRFASVDEVATMLHVSNMSIYRLVERKEISAITVGKSIRIPIKAVWDYIEAHPYVPPAETA